MAYNEVISHSIFSFLLKEALNIIRKSQVYIIFQLTWSLWIWQCGLEITKIKIVIRQIAVRRRDVVAIEILFCLFTK